MDANTAYLLAEIQHWQAETRRLEQCLSDLESRVGQAIHARETPPQPPVGTEYHHGGKVIWTRHDYGWHCSRPECSNCPARWDEVDWFKPFVAVRRLPGDPAPDTGTAPVEDDQHEVPF